ncbi:hypothetical protein Tco_1569776 [Tanacetum coccineum]
MEFLNKEGEYGLKKSVKLVEPPFTDLFPFVLFFGIGENHFTYASGDGIDSIKNEDIFSDIQLIDDGSSFEEEFVGLTVDMDDGRNNFSGEFPDEAGDNKRSPFAHSLGGILHMWDSRVFDYGANVKGSYRDGVERFSISMLGRPSSFIDFISRNGLFDFPLCGDGLLDLTKRKKSKKDMDDGLKTTLISLIIDSFNAEGKAGEMVVVKGDEITRFFTPL